MNLSDNQWKIVLGIAEGLGVALEARRKWRQRGHVPYRWRLPILEIARVQNKNLRVADFIEAA